MPVISRRQPPRHIPKALARDERGVALIEFAFSLPILLTLGLAGAELANYAITTMRISQIAISLADNASRFKEELRNGNPVIRDYDVDQAFKGAEKQAGAIDLRHNARLILSSLEMNEDGGQWIHWQRCWGDAGYRSSFGKAGDGATGTRLKGMGPAGQQVAAGDDAAIMFVEVFFDYDPLVFGALLPKDAIHKVAAMYVRDDRDLSQIYPSTGITPESCD